MGTPDPEPALDPDERHPLHALCGWLALVIPLAVTVSRVSSTTQWRDDLPVVRALGLVPIGGEGTLSSVLIQLSSFLPLGGRVFRASLASAVALAVAGRLVFALAARLLESTARAPRLTPLLALAAALTAVLAPTWQLEGTLAGGAPLAAALAFGCLLLRPSASSPDARVWLGFGGLVALTALESHAAGLALVVALATQIFVVGKVPPRKSLALWAAGAAVTLAIGLVPLGVRPFSERAWVHLGTTLSTGSVAAFDTAAEHAGVLATWFREVGLVETVLALGGLGLGLLLPRARWLAAPLATWVAADAAFRASRAGLLVSDPWVALRLMAVATLACAAALAVQSAAVAASRARLPMARATAALLVAFQLTLVLVTGEDSAYPADRRGRDAAEIWTDEALGALPPNALLLVRSPAVAWRLWAARVTRGERPDVVVVPVSLVQRGSVARQLLAIEPALAPLIRDLAVSGQPSEFSLSTLADARPLYVELDPTWDRRLMDHLVPRPLWLTFAPHAFGRSDRTAALEKGRRPFQRVLTAAQRPDREDRATLAMLRERAREQAVALAMLGDRQSVAQIVEDLRAIDPEHPLIRDLESRLAERRRGSLDVRGLLE